MTLFDTTLRDGEQSEGISFTVADKLKIAQLLDEAGIHYIEGGWPGSNPKAVDFFKQAQKLKLRHARLVAFGSTCRAHLSPAKDPNTQALLKVATPVVCIFGKSWDFHVTHALKVSLPKNLEMIENSIAYLKKRAEEVIFDAEHFFDGYKGNPSYAIEVLRAAERGGADILTLCDTNGGTLPTEIEQIVRLVREQFKSTLGIHTHNDAESGVANSLMAVQAGCRHVQGTINGIGERCGNANLVSIIPALKLKMGFSKVVSDKQLKNLRHLAFHIAEIANLVVTDRTPYVGRSAFAHKGGIHVSAILKHPRTYEHIEPTHVGNTRRVIISEQSGMSNLVVKAQEFGLPLDKADPRSQMLLETVKDLEHQGYQYEGAEASFELLMHRHLHGKKRPFQVLGFRIINEQHREDEKLGIEATLRVKVGDQLIHTAADGKGPVDALSRALNKSLLAYFPQIASMRLVDYKVRVLNTREATAAKVRVLIESADDERAWITIGVSENVIEASWLALVDAVEYKLLKSK